MHFCAACRNLQELASRTGIFVGSVYPKMKRIRILSFLLLVVLTLSAVGLLAGFSPDGEYF